MELIDIIDLMLNEEGEGAVGTTTGDVAQVEIGTKSSCKKKKRKKLKDILK